MGTPGLMSRSHELVSPPRSPLRNGLGSLVFVLTFVLVLLPQTANSIKDAASKELTVAGTELKNQKMFKSIWQGRITQGSLSARGLARHLDSLERDIQHRITKVEQALKVVRVCVVHTLLAKKV